MLMRWHVRVTVLAVSEPKTSRMKRGDGERPRGVWKVGKGRLSLVSRDPMELEAAVVEGTG